MHSSPQERLAAIESLDDMIIAVDRELRVISWNAAAERLMDRPAAQAAGTALMTMITPRLRVEFGALLGRALAGETIARRDVTMMRPDGTEIVLSVAIGPMGGVPRQPAGLILIGHDVAAQQRLQFQLLQSKRMESTGHLAGGIAHEFNNILTAILGLTEFTARALPADARAQGDVREIREQATKGARLVRHLLAFSKRQLLRTEVTRLGPILQELEPLLQRLVSERILIAIDVSGDSRPVEIDRGQIELVMLEIVANAADAMEQGGTLSVDIRPTSISGHPSLTTGDYVQATFKDDGAGFDPANRSRVFEPFFTTKGDGHTGLGLAMVEGVVQDHGGSVGIESIPGDGTKVTLLLPAAAKATAPTREQPVSAAGSGEGTETIMVVEDEVSVRLVVCRGLTARGYTVLEAKNGEDALMVAERHAAPVHLVITDVVMPEMNGTDLYRHLRRWYPTMRVLFISGYSKSAIPPEALEEGMGASFLAKPFTLDELFREVRRLIQAPRPKTPAGV